MSKTINIDVQNEPQGSIENITYCELTFTENDINNLRQAQAVMAIHTSFDHVVFNFEGGSRPGNDTRLPVEWKYDVEQIMVYRNTFRYIAQGKWDCRDELESVDVSIDLIINKQFLR